jgi:hypothetical protein
MVQVSIANWGKLAPQDPPRTTVAWDLHLQPTSPALKAAADGTNIGSSINVAQYRAGDFNGDGVRDLPKIP